MSYNFLGKALYFEVYDEISCYKYNINKNIKEKNIQQRYKVFFFIKNTNATTVSTNKILMIL